MANFEGLNETLAMFDEAPRVIVAGAFFKALQAGAKVMGAELSIRTPKGEAIGPDATSRLSENQVTDILLNPDLSGGTVEIGFGKQGHVALWIEFGHRLVGHRPGRKLLGQVAAMPFMRTTVDSCYEAVTEAFTDSLEDSFHSLKLGV
jgi:hypothetical protein